jgi:FAD/FMN-containing dehydrogenase
VTAREDLASTGAALVDDGEGGLRVTPPSTASLARAVAVVRAHGLPLRIRGSGDAPANAPAGGVLLDLASLDRIASVDATTGIARVEAGCSVAALESAVRRSGCTLGPLLPSVRAGSVGAWLAGPTRGQRGVPGARRQTAALTVAAVLGDGRIAEGCAAPAKAVGPDLDRLALGGGGRLCVVAAAWIRLSAVSPALPSAWSCAGLEAALTALEHLCAERLAPARARILAAAEGATLGMTWEGLASAEIERDRASRILGATCAPAPEVPGNFVREPPQGHPVEVDARWGSLRGWSPHGDLHLFGLHAGGAFAVLSLPDAGAGEQGAALARTAGARVIAPGRLRDTGPGWEAAGAAGAWGRLNDALGLPP